MENYQEVNSAPMINLINSEGPNLRMIHSTNIQQFFNEPIGSLSKAAFSGAASNVFICGTEFDEDEKLFDNKLIIGTIDSNTNKASIKYLPISSPVRDVVWFDYQRAIVAINHQIAIANVGQDNSIAELIPFPEFHTDTIRQIAINTDHGLVLSGGFDGNVFVTNVSRLVDDIQKNERKSENSVYLCRNVVGSVQWHISDVNVASATTDMGVLHVFDIRINESKPAFIFDTHRTGLYSHAYLDDFLIAMGYSDGSLIIQDIRYGKEVCVIKDPYQKAVGDIKILNHFSPLQIHEQQLGNLEEDNTTPVMRSICLFGQPEVSIWNLQQDYSMYCMGHHTNLNNTNDHSFKTNGDLIPNSNMIAVTDSYSNLNIYDLSLQ